MVSLCRSADLIHSLITSPALKNIEILWSRFAVRGSVEVVDSHGLLVDVVVMLQRSSFICPRFHRSRWYDSRGLLVDVVVMLQCCAFFCLRFHRSCWYDSRGLLVDDVFMLQSWYAVIVYLLTSSILLPPRFFFQIISILWRVVQNLSLAAYVQKCN